MKDRQFFVDIGRKGGKKKVKKGFAVGNNAKKAAAKRWGHEIKPV